MNSKKLAVLSVLSLTIVLGLMFFGGRRAQAASTWYVSPTGTPSGTSGGSCASPSFNTIGAAIAAASSGDTIQVCAGIYNEQVQVNKTLTLNGAQAGVDARTRVPSAESIIDHPCGPVQIMADNVVLNGFTVQGSTLSDPCFLSGIWTNPGFSGTQGGHQILNNIVQNNISGIELDSTCTYPTLVQFNLIQNNNNPGPGATNAIQTNFGLCNATIDSNKFSGHANSSVFIIGGGNDLTVSNNELVGGTSERIVFVGVTNSAINGNTSIGSTAVNGPIRFAGTNSNITINSNVLRNGVRGIKVDGTNTNITAHLNCIEGNTVAGLDVTAGAYSGTLDAENNWWGSASGPAPTGTGNAVIDPSGVVDYMPFLISNAGTPCADPDLCPDDPNKIAPGQCGCGVADTDSDGDGTADCNDTCPSDPNKTAPGLCGCGVADTDTDGDGTPNCNDTCPNDPNKTAPGACGCGVPDTDSDGDGVPNCNDNCPGTPPGTQVNAFGCPLAINQNQCKKDGWKTVFRANGTPFKNQGDCMQYVNTGK